MKHHNSGNSTARVISDNIKTRPIVPYVRDSKYSLFCELVDAHSTLLPAEGCGPDVASVSYSLKGIYDLLGGAVSSPLLDHAWVEAVVYGSRGVLLPFEKLSCA